MTGTKSEMAFVKFTKDELYCLLERAVKEKYPDLIRDTRWVWEDVSMSAGIDSHDFDDNRVAVELIFTKHEEPLDKPCRCGVDSFCG